MIAVPKITERIRKASRHCLTDGCEGCQYWDRGGEGDDPSCDQIAILEDAIRLTAAIDLLRSEKDEAPTVEPKREWISVKDRLPDRLDEYLVVNCGKVGLAIYHDGLWFAPTRKVEITHWMPLPEPPKMEGSETDGR